MGFYYTSIFSIVPLGIAYCLLALPYWAIVHGSRGASHRIVLLGGVGLLFLLLPFSSELWTAWHFGQACKGAGTFIHKTANVDGFYLDDGSRGGGPLDLVRPGNYRFVEAQTEKGFNRLEYGDAALLQQAYSRFRESNQAKDPLALDILRVPLDERTEILVFPKKGESWRISLIDKPNARYYYKYRSHIPEAFKVVRHEGSVVDAHTGQMLGKELSFGRYAPWFFIGLDAPVMLCYGERNVRGMLYSNVLLPIRHAL